MITLIARFTMQRGKVDDALELVNAVKAQSDAEQPGTLFYLVHRELDRNHRATRTLTFYECYRDEKALKKHLNASSWKALIAHWNSCFEGTPKDIVVTSLDRLGGFVRLDVP